MVDLMRRIWSSAAANPSTDAGLLAFRSLIIVHVSKAILVFLEIEFSEITPLLKKSSTTTAKSFSWILKLTLICTDQGIDRRRMGPNRALTHTDLELIQSLSGPTDILSLGLERSIDRH